MKKVFLLLVILLSFNGFACSCDQTPTVKQAWTNAEEVFTAKIISVDSSHFSSTGDKIYLFTVKVMHFFKKSPYAYHEEMRTLYFSGNGGGCDFLFNLNKEYLIYVSRNQGIISSASICSRTALLSDVKQEEINELALLSKQIVPSNTKNTDIDIISWVSEKELKNFRQQAVSAQKLAKQNKYLMIICGILFIAALIFILFYIKTKRKPKILNHKEH